MNSSRCNVAVGVLALTFAASGLSAQAWLPLKSEGYLSLFIQSTDAHVHWLSTRDNPFVPGSRTLDDGEDIEGQVAVLAVDYGLTKRMALSGQIAYVEGRYRGPFPEGAGDDGSYHGGLQDVSLGWRYQAVQGLWVVTPSVTVGAPTRSYEVLAHSAIGRGLNELRLGANVGRSLPSLLGKPAYVEGAYSYAFVENIQQFNVDRSNAGIELGVLATPSLVLRFIAAGQRTHDGIDWVTDLADEHDEEMHFESHDQGAEANWFQGGLGIGYALTPKISLNASYISTLWGENTHDADAVTIGLERSFGIRRLGRKPVVD